MIPLNIRSFNSDRVLVYHSVGGGFWDDISPESFRTHLEILDRRWDIVDLPSVVGANEAGKQVALTFDDGLCDFYENVLPLLREFDAPASVFVIAETLSNPDFCHDSAFEYEYLSEDQLLELADEALVTIGNHTKTHPDLSQVESTAELEDEILGGKVELEERLGISVDQFAYPYYQCSKESVELVRRTHSYAVRGWGSGERVTERRDPCLLPRMNGAMDPTSLRWRITDLGAFVSALHDRLP